MFIKEKRKGWKAELKIDKFLHDCKNKDFNYEKNKYKINSIFKEIKVLLESLRGELLFEKEYNEYEKNTLTFIFHETLHNYNVLKEENDELKKELVKHVKLDSNKFLN